VELDFFKIINAKCNENDFGDSLKHKFIMTLPDFIIICKLIYDHIYYIDDDSTESFLINTSKKITYFGGKKESQINTALYVSIKKII